jgi:hypothetical protein
VATRQRRARRSPLGRRTSLKGARGRSHEVRRSSQGSDSDSESPDLSSLDWNPAGPGPTTLPGRAAYPPAGPRAHLPGRVLTCSDWPPGPGLSEERYVGTGVRAGPGRRRTVETLACGEPTRTGR